MVQSTRCRYIVFDNETKRHRLCKKKYCVNNQYCIIHAKFLYNEKAIYIQKIFRAHYIRKKINIIYKKLPTDLQHTILDFIESEYRIIQYNKNIRKFVKNKCSTFFDALILISLTSNLILPYHTLLQELFHNIYLIEKYEIEYLYSESNFKNLFILIKKLHEVLYNVIYNQMYNSWTEYDNNSWLKFCKFAKKIKFEYYDNSYLK